MKSKLKIFLLVLTAVNLTIVIIFIIPEIWRLSKISQRVYQSKYLLSENNLINKSINSSEFQAKKDKINKVLEIFVQRDEVVQFIENLEQMSEKYGFSQKISIADGITAENNGELIIQVPITIELAGDLENMLPYILKLENLSTYMNIDDMSIVSAMPEERMYSTSEIEMEDKTGSPVRIIMNGNIFLIDHYDQL